METLICAIRLHVRGVCASVCVRRPLFRSVSACVHMWVCCSANACVCVWCILLTDVLTAQSSSNLSEEEGAACSDLWKAQKLQMSETRTVSGLWISLFLPPSLFLYSSLYMSIQTQKDLLGENFVFTYPNKYLQISASSWINQWLRGGV